MSDKVYLPMDSKMRDELRFAMNTQFRYKLYRDPIFPFLPSLGIDHIIQGFEHKEEKSFVEYFTYGMKTILENSLIKLKINTL